MKKYACILLMMLMLSGCAELAKMEHLPAGDFSAGEGQRGASQCLSILQQVWDQYTLEDRFSVYGGSSRMPVYGGPAVLPDGYEIGGGQPADGAAVTHLFHGDIFRAAVICLQQGQEGREVARGAIKPVSGKRSSRYFLAAEVTPGYLALVWGDRDKVALFEKKLTELFGGAQVYYSGPLPLERKTPGQFMKPLRGKLYSCLGSRLS